MSFRICHVSCCLTFLAVLLTAAPSCKKDGKKSTADSTTLTPKSSAPKAEPTTSSAKKELKSTMTAEDDHPEKGPHGGPLAEWEKDGKEEFHVELIVDKQKKQIVIYLLDDKAKGPAKLDPAKVTEVIFLPGNTKLAVELKHAPKAKGKDIVFVSDNDAFGKDVQLKGSNISGKIDGRPYSGDFKEGK